ncbi:MAG: glycosyltransferase family 39 protein [Chloroflexota bacterium]
MAILLVAFSAATLIYIWLVPPFEGPDEPEHFGYVSWLAQGKGFPPQGNAAWETPVRQEASQPPFYYIVASLPARLAGLEEPAIVFRPNPHFPSNAPGTIADNKNVAVHYPEDGTPLRGGWLALTMARGTSLLFGLGLLICVYGLARQVYPESQGFALAAATLVAVIPQTLFMSSLVSNDMAAAATGALTLWLLAVLVRKGPTGWRGLALGAAYGLAILSKASSLVLIVPIGLGLVWILWQRKDQPGAVARAIIGVGAAAFVVAGWWYIRSWILYGTPLGLSTHYQAPWAVAAVGQRIQPAAAWREVFDSFWAAFGWGNIKFPWWIYAVLGGIVVVAIVGLTLATWRWWRGDRKEQTRPLLLALLALSVLCLVVALEIWMRQVTAPHGRLLFPALAAVAVLLVAGWRAIHSWLVAAGISLVLLLAILAPVTLIHPAYALPQLTPVNQASGQGESIGWRFGDIAKLAAVQPAQRSVAAGGTLPIDVCWITQAPAAKDYSVLVHIVGPDNQVVAGRHTYPGLGSFPTSTWQVGQHFCDTIRVDIPDDLARTLAYQVEIGLLDSVSNDRLPVTGPSGETLASTFATTVRLETADAPQLSAAPAGSGTIRLLEADYPETWPSGETFDVALRWWLAEPVDQDYSVFVHLRDPGSGDIVAQGDGPPLDGWYPTSMWQAGEIVDDEHGVLAPSITAASRFDLVVGWYDLDSGTRLGPEHLLGQVEVLP